MTTLLISIIIIIQSFYFQTYAILKNYKKYTTVSHMYAEKEFRNNFRIGLTLSGLLQILLMLSLNHEGVADGFGLGQIMFTVGAISMVYIGWVSYFEHKSTHLIVSYIYFLATAIGGFLITINLEIDDVIQLLMVFTILAWIIFSVYQIPKSNRLYAIETDHVLLSYAWILLLSLGIVLNP